MAAGGAAVGIHRASTFSTLTPERKASRRSQRRIVSVTSSSLAKPPLILSTDPSHVDIHRLKDLYAACSISGHRFPSFDLDGRVERVDLKKLRIAVSNSFVVVSVFGRRSMSSGLFERMVPLTHGSGELVGFGRAVSDSSLTASIHDVMVIPSLRRMGIGRMIVKRLIRVLTSKDIYDIAALCNKNDRLFFGACGFGDDMLNSTTMMYKRSVFLTSNDQMVAEPAAKRSAAFSQFMKDLSVPADIRVKALTDISAQAKLSDVAKNFIVLLAESGSLKSIEIIAKRYRELAMARKGEMKAVLTTVIPLPADEEKELKETAQYLTGGKKILLEQKIDPSILGGIVVEFDQKMLDMSIRTRAKQMERFLWEPINFDGL